MLASHRMRVLALLSGAAIALLVYWETFETMVLPRRLSRRFRLTRAFYRWTWMPWRKLGACLGGERRREAFLSVYGPMSLLLLLVLWAGLLVFAFALLLWGGGSGIEAPSGLQGFSADLALSGAMLFSLSLRGFPVSVVELSFGILEAATGLAFLAIVIGYFPSLWQAFSKREANVRLLDARAGSPPSAGELLVRYVELGEEPIARLLEEWDSWVADLLETHISFPVLVYYRSQQEKQSWVAALTTILDTCSLIIVASELQPVASARLTFTIARRAAKDLSRAIRLEPMSVQPDRLDAAELRRLRAQLRSVGLALEEGPELAERLAHLRRSYEPYVSALADYLLMPLPPWVGAEPGLSDWFEARTLPREPRRTPEGSPAISTMSGEPISKSSS